MTFPNYNPGKQLQPIWKVLVSDLKVQTLVKNENHLVIPIGMAT